MNMKKIIAGVAAAALTATSLAVVNVSAEEDVKTFNFVGKLGSVSATYSYNIGFRGGIAPEEVFTATKDSNGTQKYVFNYALSAGLKSGYKSDDLDAVNALLGNVKRSGGTTFTVVGIAEDIDGRSKEITRKATSATKEYLAINNYAESDVKKANGELAETIRVRWDGDSAGATLASNDLDVSEMVKITSITITSSFNFSTGAYEINPDGVFMNISLVSEQSLDIGGGVNYWANYTTSTKDSDGKVIYVDNAYCFEGGLYTDADGVVRASTHEIGAWADGSAIVAESLGSNLLRWVNDNIVQNRGAKIRINFMQPGQLKDAISKGGGSEYNAVEYGWAHAPVLVPGSSSTTTAADIAIGVNLKNTTRLQQTGTINDYSVEFDWDSLVMNSTATVSGNVDSIAIRVVNTENVKNNYADSNGRIGIKSIELIIPERTDVPTGTTWEDTLTKAVDENSGVIAEGTNKALTGNGGVILKATGTLTSNKLAYEVKLLNKDGVAVQPAGEITLTLPIPKDNQGKTIKGGTVAHTKGDGTVENLTILNDYKADGFVKVVTTSLSPFEMEFEEDETTTEAPETTTEAPETTTEAPATTTEAPAETTAAPAPAGDKNANTGVAIAIVPAVIAAAGVIISKKRK